ncbi:TPA: DUF4422 domain-containing protein, partial [Campylobacter jejuni]|nr:DUF4422 domain-containing protein [Campylobacter jejuni]
MIKKTKIPKIKILVGYHKPAILLKDDILTPIHLGRALATQASKDGEMSREDFEWMCKNMIGDDIGDNISYLNRYFCELTGIYWAWKNYDKLDNPDYIGFMHYRRIFDFCGKSVKLPIEHLNCANIEYINEQNMYDYLNRENIIKTIIENQYIISQKYILNPFEHYKNHHKITDYIYALKLIDELFPEIKMASKKYNENKISYFCNMFVLPKKDFFDLCSFVFKIIFSLHDNIKNNYCNQTIQEQRTCGYISEWLTGIYFTHLKEKNKIIYELPIVYIKNTNIIHFPIPKKNNQVSLCFSINNEYFIYFYTALKSLISHINQDFFYEILILSDDLQKRFKDELLHLNQDNVIITLLNIQSFISSIDINIFYESAHIKKETYFRFFIPKIFKYYNKILYLDSDIIVSGDISELFFYKIANDKIIAAVPDIAVHNFIQTNYKIKYLSKSLQYYKYCNEILQINQMQNYFNAGVILFDIVKCRQFNLEEKVLAKLKEIKEPVFWDQDILNSVLQNKIEILDFVWNYQQNIGFNIEKLNKEIYKKYEEDYKDIKIYHYISGLKPWNSPHLSNAYL